MAVLGIDVIRRYKDELFLENFDEKCLDLASYNLRVGTQDVIIEGKYIPQYVGNTIIIPPHQKAYLFTHERIQLPYDICGEIFLRRTWSNLGLSLEGRFIDPLFEGRLSLILRNEVDEAVVISTNPPETIAILRLHKVAYLGPQHDELLRELLIARKKVVRFDAETRNRLMNKAQISYIFNDVRAHSDAVKELKQETSNLGTHIQQITTESQRAVKDVTEIQEEVANLGERIHLATATSQYAVWGGIVLIAITVLAAALQTIFASWNSSLTIVTGLSTLPRTEDIMWLMWMPVITVALFMAFLVLITALIIVAIIWQIRRRLRRTG